MSPAPGRLRHGEWGKLKVDNGKLKVGAGIARPNLAGGSGVYLRQS